MTTEILLCNFGGPTSGDQVEPFLYALFSDPAILRIPSWLRPWLARRIAVRRAPKVLKDYETIGFSPINRYTDAQAAHLQSLVPASCKVHVINRYTQPRAAHVLPLLEKAPKQRFILGLYPHFSTTSTGSSFDELDHLARTQLGLDKLPGIKIQSWWDHPPYMDLCTEYIRAAIQDYLQEHKTSDSLTILCSAHGIPENFVKSGDPYQDHVLKHAFALEKKVMEPLRMHLPSGFSLHWNVSFQSRVGPIAWVKPYTDKLIPVLGQERKGGLIIVPISFISDHLETLFEIEHTYKALALAHGFHFCTRTPLPNADPRFAACVFALLKNHGLE